MGRAVGGMVCYCKGVVVMVEELGSCGLVKMF